MNDIIISPAPRAPKRFARVEAKLPPHRIVYVGLDEDAAKHAHAVCSLHGVTAHYLRERVVGSRLRDPHPWHCTVTAYDASEQSFDNLEADINLIQS